MKEIHEVIIRYCLKESILLKNLDTLDLYNIEEFQDGEIHYNYTELRKALYEII